MADRAPPRPSRASASAAPPFAIAPLPLSHPSRPPAVGRLKHFATITSPLTLFATKSDLARAQQLVLEYKAGVGEGRRAWGREDAAGIWKAKQCEQGGLFVRGLGNQADCWAVLSSVRLFTPPWSVPPSSFSHRTPLHRHSLTPSLSCP